MDIGLDFDKDVTVYIHGIPSVADLPVGAVPKGDVPGSEVHELRIGQIYVKLFVDKPNS